MGNLFVLYNVVTILVYNEWRLCCICMSVYWQSCVLNV